MGEVKLRMQNARQVLARCMVNLDEYLDGDQSNANKTKILRELKHRRSVNGMLIK